MNKVIKHCHMVLYRLYFINYIQIPWCHSLVPTVEVLIYTKLSHGTFTWLFHSVPNLENLANWLNVYKISCISKNWNVYNQIHNRKIAVNKKRAKQAL